MRRVGASLIWTVIVCAVLMTIGSTITAAIVKESQMSVRMDDSAKAYAAAESGIEWAKWCLGYKECSDVVSVGARQDGGYFSPVVKLGESEYNVTIIYHTEKNTYTINSVGKSNGVNRAIEYSTEEVKESVIFGTDPDKNMDVDNIESPMSVDSIHGFKTSFDYWEGQPSLNESELLWKSDTTTDAIGVKFSPGGVDLVAKHDGINLSSTPDGKIKYPPLDGGPTAPYASRIYLTYIPNIGIKLEVYSRYNKEYACIGTKSVKFDGANRVLSLSPKITIAASSGSLEVGKHPALGDSNLVYIYSDGGGKGYIDNMVATGLTPNTVATPEVPTPIAQSVVITILTPNSAALHWTASTTGIAAPFTVKVYKSDGAGGYVADGEVSVLEGSFAPSRNEQLTSSIEELFAGGYIEVNGIKSNIIPDTRWELEL